MVESRIAHACVQRFEGIDLRPVSVDSATNVCLTGTNLQCHIYSNDKRCSSHTLTVEILLNRTELHTL